MSRLEIPSKHPDLEVVVGWHEPGATFFAQVGPRDCDIHELVLWLGTEAGQHLHPLEMVVELEPYADLDEAIIHQSAKAGLARR